MTVLSAALLSVSVVSPAGAADKDKTDDKQPKPSGQMSTVGGARLGEVGTQVALGPGAPVLPKELTARSWIVADAESGDVLASHNAHWRLPPASTLKMLFADTVLPALQPKTLTHLVTEDELSGVGEGSSLVGVKEDHSYTVHDLWLGVFLRSGNDAVHVLSEMYGGVAGDGRRDAAARRGAPGPGHDGRLARRLRRPAAGVQRVRPDAVRPERDAEGGLPGVRRDGDGGVPRRAEEGQEAGDLRDPEHQPADHR